VAFAVMAAVTAAMMFDFAYFREQTCIVACPYGRFQSALLDRNSMIVTYDRKRGEPRGHGKRSGNTKNADVSLPVIAPAKATAATSAASTLGDCVDCGMCVQVCPTGIDIREGLQMECIGCAQCIDACDAVMGKVKRPVGLIRYSSEAALAGEKQRLVRPRTMIYPVLLGIVVSAFLVLMIGRAPVDVTVLRGLGRPFIELADERIGNQIRIKIVNRTDALADYSISVSEPDAKIEVEATSLRIGPGEMLTVPAMLSAPRSAFTGGTHVVPFTIDDGRGYRKFIRYNLMGPGSMHHDASERGGAKGPGTDEKHGETGQPPRDRPENDHAEKEHNR